MNRKNWKMLVVLTLLAFGIVFEIPGMTPLSLFQTTEAEAVIGRPVTPVSYAGVARRTTVRRAARPGVNRGGPVNRVGVR